ncbi:MAG: hypothetical protein HOP15_11675 [Planctomycetes bacterium]|nr:hypothetical protein [Planctomycetota bacterium]
MQAARVFGLLFSAYMVARGWRSQSVLLGLVGLALFFGPLRRWAALVALAYYLTPGLGRLGSEPFLAGNHEYLEALFLLILALEPGRDAVGRVHLGRTVGAVAVALVFLSGVQKVAHGAYVRGDFFTQCYAQPTKFSKLFDPFVSAEERDAARDFRGAFGFFSREVREGVLDMPPPRPPVVAWVSRSLCWATLAAELLLPWLLLAHRARERKLGAALLIAFFAAVEAAAREWMFGGLVLCLLLPVFFERDLAPTSLTSGTGRRSTLALRALVVLVCTWPFVHMYLAFAHDLSPWKLAGFGMYTLPARVGALSVEIRQGNSEFRPRRPRDGSEAERYEETSYALRNVPFSSAAARDLARWVQERTPKGALRPEVRIRATTVRLDREIDRYRSTMRAWTYPP